MGEFVISMDGQNYLPQDKEYEYVKGKGILVGCFNEQQIKDKEDKVAIRNMMDTTGYKYTNTEFVKKNGKLTGIKVYVCELDDMELQEGNIIKVYDIKWDVTDGAEEMTPEEIEETLAMLPKELELPEKFDKENYIEDGEFDEDEWLDAISDWLSEDYGFCHDGFKISEEEKDQEMFEGRE